MSRECPGQSKSSINICGLDFPGGIVDKNLPVNKGDKGLILGPHATEQPSVCAPTSEPECLEPVLCNKRIDCNDKPGPRSKEWPSLAATEESLLAAGQHPEQALLPPDIYKYICGANERLH